jgi:hypothetical protein
MSVHNVVFNECFLVSLNNSSIMIVDRMDLKSAHVEKQSMVNILVDSEPAYLGFISNDRSVLLV